MDSNDKFEEDLLAFDDTDVPETGAKENVAFDSKDEDKLLSKEDSDIESLPEVIESSDATVTSTNSVEPTNSRASQESTSSGYDTIGSTSTRVDSKIEGHRNEESSEKKEDSDEDIVEIAVIQNKPTQNIQNSLAIGSSNIHSEHLRRAREEERKRLLQREKISEFNFRSNRLQQQRKRVRYNTDGRPVIYADDFDFCDCLQENCPGCHYPCKSCGDCRCGHECRVNRRYVYESIELEGRNIVLKTPKGTTKSTV